MQVGRTATARSLRGFLVYFFAESHHDDSPLRRPDSLGSIRAMVTDMVHALCEAPTPLPGSDASASARVRMACDYMRARADEALTVEQVALAVGIGSRSLQAAFRDILGMTPREKLAEIRLENARERLLAPEPGTTVTNLALDCGFAHIGRFAAAYRHRYGESPSETLRLALQ